MLPFSKRYQDDNQAVAVARDLKTSPCGELEITTLDRLNLEQGELSVETMGHVSAWLGTETHALLLDAANYDRIIEERHGLKIVCPKGIA